MARVDCAVSAGQSPARRKRNASNSIQARAVDDGARKSRYRHLRRAFPGCDPATTSFLPPLARRSILPGNIAAPREQPPEPERR